MKIYGKMNRMRNIIKEIESIRFYLDFHTSSKEDEIYARELLDELENKIKKEDENG